MSSASVYLLDKFSVFRLNFHCILYSCLASEKYDIHGLLLTERVIGSKLGHVLASRNVENSMILALLFGAVGLLLLLGRFQVKVLDMGAS
jgi:hypothetical protein